MGKLWMVWWEKESIPSSLHSSSHDLFVIGPYPHSLGPSFTRGVLLQRCPRRRTSHWGTRVLVPQMGVLRMKKVGWTNQWRELKGSGWWNRERWRWSWSEGSEVCETNMLQQHSHPMLVVSVSTNNLVQFNGWHVKLVQSTVQLYCVSVQHNL